MNKWRLLGAFFVIAGLIITFSGCDQKNSLASTIQNPLVGKWALIGYEGIYEGYEFTNDNKCTWILGQGSVQLSWEKIIFDMTINGDIVSCTNGKLYERDSYYGTWPDYEFKFVIKDDKLYISNDINDSINTDVTKYLTRVDDFPFEYGSYRSP